MNYGGLTSLALGNPRERKILHICDSDYTTWGVAKIHGTGEWLRLLLSLLRFLWKQWREYVEVSDSSSVIMSLILLLCFIKY